jgi:hypothetical protein
MTFRDSQSPRRRAFSVATSVYVLVIAGLVSSGCAIAPSTRGAVHEEPEYRTGSNLRVRDRADWAVDSAKLGDINAAITLSPRKPVVPQRP